MLFAAQAQPQMIFSNRVGEPDWRSCRPVHVRCAVMIMISSLFWLPHAYLSAVTTLSEALNAWLNERSPQTMFCTPVSWRQ